MIKIRNGVFETNSSSVHSLCIVSEDEFDKWKKEKLIYDYYNEELVDASKAEEDDDEYRYYTFDDFFHNWERMEYETFTQNYTSESGDRIIAFGYYGND